MYNPKVISASKGSFTRVDWWYGDIVPVLSQQQTTTARTNTGPGVYGAFLDGDDVHKLMFSPQGGYLVMGNESSGIRPDVATYVTKRVTIPRYGEAESLNVGIATAILLDNIRQRTSQV